MHYRGAYYDACIIILSSLREHDAEIDASLHNGAFKIINKRLKHFGMTLILLNCNKINCEARSLCRQLEQRWILINGEKEKDDKREIRDWKVLMSLIKCFHHFAASEGVVKLPCHCLDLTCCVRNRTVRTGKCRRSACTGQLERP